MWRRVSPGVACLLIMFAASTACPQGLRPLDQLRAGGPATGDASTKIVSRLRALITDLRAEGITRENAAVLDTARRFSSETLKVDDLARVQVYVDVSDTSEPALSRLRQHGLDLEIVNRDFTIVQGWIPIENLEGLAAESVVLKIRPASYGRQRTGSVTSEGDAIHRCAEARATLGVTGAGVTVGVVSDGVDGLAAAQASGDLAAVLVLSPGGGDEGTAILEIIHDCAPGATLAFASYGGTTLGFIAAVNALRDAGAKIIVDDIGFYQEPFFEDGEVARNHRLVGFGVILASAGGNDTLAHFQGMFTPGTFDPQIPGTRHNFGGGDTLLRFSMAGGTIASVVLQWGNPFGSAGDDYDLCVRGPDGTLIRCSVFVQDGNDDPIERV